MALNYLSNTTCPEITLRSVSLSQFLNEPGSNHWDARIQGSEISEGGPKRLSQALKTEGQSDTLVGYADADWASSPDAAAPTLSAINSVLCATHSCVQTQENPAISSSLPEPANSPIISD
ncbi:hypothetical protein PGT21_030500 [Puccinia graminis f. sp. tritici]|uniref:Uncharacterized protein n=1 Tax=Puccinia graminis f. sp. tritici TaxID=56615 RepID=A0A5B0LQQ2_PUCGR|nr:hypothetical protein PGT21_030500 [Puccinia graminis f. sp. tritici]